MKPRRKLKVKQKAINSVNRNANSAKQQTKPINLAENNKPNIGQHAKQRAMQAKHKEVNPAQEKVAKK